MRPIPRFLLGGFLMTAFLVALWVTLFQIQLGKPTRLGLPLHELVQFKQDALRAEPGPRVIVVGGSNVTFSISTELLSDYTPYPACNFGTHAGFNLDFLFDLVGDEVRSGDILVLALEYQYYAYDGKYSSVQSDYICGYYPEYLKRLSPLERTRLIFSFNFWGLTEPSLSLLQRSFQRSKPDREILRGAQLSYLNAHGDSIATSIANRTAADFKNVLNGGAFLLSLDGKEASWSIIEDFLQAMKARGVRVFQTWPVTRYFEEYSTPDSIRSHRQIEEFFTAHGVPTLGHPEDFMYPTEDFFDTGYHLVRERQKVPTRLLGKKLTEQLD